MSHMFHFLKFSIRNSRKRSCSKLRPVNSVQNYLNRFRVIQLFITRLLYPKKMPCIVDFDVYCQKFADICVSLVVFAVQLGEVFTLILHSHYLLLFKTSVMDNSRSLCLFTLKSVIHLPIQIMTCFTGLQICSQYIPRN